MTIDEIRTLALARNAARNKVTQWMASEAVAGNLRSNGEAPAWQEYQDAIKALNLAIDELGEMPASSGDELTLHLEAIAAQIRAWLDWHKAHRDKEILVTDGDTSIMALPVPFWPSHGQFENWIKTLNEAAEAIGTGSTCPRAHWNGKT